MSASKLTEKQEGNISLVKMLLELPSIVHEQKQDYELRIIKNHNHLRIGYFNNEGGFLNLVENIESDSDLIEAIDLIKEQLL